jgi:hypothetical protein
MPHAPVYVIELESNKWYVWRHDQHNTAAVWLIACFYTPWKGVGTPAWIEKYRPLATNPVPTPDRCGSLDDDSLDRFVLNMMKEKGMDNVRGGSFQAIDLTKEDVMRLARRHIPTHTERVEREFELEVLERLRRMEERLNFD